MNEEQRAVLETVARMEQHPSGSVDEYTVARASGVLARDLSGQDWLHAAERDHIRRIFDNLEDEGLLRIDRTGYWRPRTSLAGRRIVQGLPAAVVPHYNPSATWHDEPAAEARPIRPARTEETDLEEPPTRLRYGEKPRPGDRGWPAWWPAALRIGDPSVTPIVVPVVILALLLMLVLGVRVLGSRGSTPAPTVTVNARASATAGAIGVAPTRGAGGPPTPGAGGTNTGVTPTTGARPTRGPQATATQAVIIPQVRIANTDNEAAFMFATPAGEKMDVAIPEGTLVDDIGPDEQDPYGVTWKHVRFGDSVGWVPKQYTAPVKSGETQ
ncbi:MAG: hypothetical protein ACTHMP_07335 [Thermomicrobiales bacterium]